MIAIPKHNLNRTDGILHLVSEIIERSHPYRFMSDERLLLKSMRRLDPEAITVVHKRFFPDVFRYARYRLGDIALAEDIASETFTRLLDALHKGKGPQKSMRGWLMGTASNLINNYFRKSYAQPVESIAEGMELDALGGNPSTHMEQEDRRQKIRNALKSLPQSQQHVIALRFGTGCSLAETAEIMNKKPNAIKQLQFRALTSLREKLGGELDV